MNKQHKLFVIAAILTCVLMSIIAAIVMFKPEKFTTIVRRSGGSYPVFVPIGGGYGGGTTIVNNNAGEGGGTTTTTSTSQSPAATAIAIIVIVLFILLVLWCIFSLPSYSDDVTVIKDGKNDVIVV